ncbi:MAG TPA: acyl-CoA dehydrogenase family protein [Acidimicrobiales bacterium]|jgi:alkylation response protein AidB-like acyl-CoA dehydrogenase
MDLRDSPSDAAFRREVGEWLDATLPSLPPKPPMDDFEARRRYDTHWQRTLFDAGYAGINWPAEHGGRGATATEQLIFLEESERRRAPYVGSNFVGLLHAGPTLIAEASPRQQAAHLPPILRGEHVWCQGFSEPAAGSDLASLRTRAVRDGDEYVVSGQKIWTSFAQIADFCELLVRTDPDAPKHRGITWLIMSMDTPGIEVRPLRTVHGSPEFSEVFLDEVRIPVGNRVGAENDGWRVAMVTFSFERGTAFVSELLGTRRLVADLKALATTITRRGATAWDDSGLRSDLGHLDAELEALWALTKRNVSQAQRTGVPGVGGSVFKLSYTELRHRLADVSRRLLDRMVLSHDDLGEWPTGDHMHGLFHALAMSVAAGTSQIQRNIVAERILGLPKEPPWTSS